jgi:hypothetical protein
MSLDFSNQEFAEASHLAPPNIYILVSMATATCPDLAEGPTPLVCGWLQVDVSKISFFIYSDVTCIENMQIALWSDLTVGSTENIKILSDRYARMIAARRGRCPIEFSDLRHNLFGSFRFDDVHIIYFDWKKNYYFVARFFFTWREIEGTTPDPRLSIQVTGGMSSRSVGLWTTFDDRSFGADRHFSVVGIDRVTPLFITC